MKRRLTQSIAGLLLVCMAGSTIFGAASVTRKGAPKPEPTTTAAPSTGMPGKAPTKEPSKVPKPEQVPTTPIAPAPPTNKPVAPKPSAKPEQPATPIAPAPPTNKPVAPKPSAKPEQPATPIAPAPPTNKPVAPKPSAKPEQPATPIAPAPPTSKPVAPKPSTCPNKPSTCPNKKPECQNKPKPFALDNFKVIQATLAGCGVDGQELAAYIKQGKKLEDVLKAENISVRKFKKRVLKEYCKVINEAVKSGQLTNEQGAQLKEAIKDTVKNWLPKK